MKKIIVDVLDLDSCADSEKRFEDMDTEENVTLSSPAETIRKTAINKKKTVTASSSQSKKKVNVPSQGRKMLTWKKWSCPLLTKVINKASKLQNCFAISSILFNS